MKEAKLAMDEKVRLSRTEGSMSPNLMKERMILKKTSDPVASPSISMKLMNQGETILTKKVSCTSKNPLE